MQKFCADVQVFKQKGKEKYNVITIKFEILYLITLIIIITILPYHNKYIIIVCGGNKKIHTKSTPVPYFTSVSNMG